MCSKLRSRAEGERNQRAHALANVTGLTQSLRRPTIPPWTAAVSRAGYGHCDDCGARIRIMAKRFADDSRVRTRALQACLVLMNSEQVRCPIL
jgi:hypothetical protein